MTTKFSEVPSCNILSTQYELADHTVTTAKASLEQLEESNGVNKSPPPGKRLH